MSGRLQHEIQQTRPFLSSGEEAFLSLQRTAALLGQGLAHRLKEHGLSASQYNALRILRGAHPGTLPCGEVGARMVTPEPDVTRLLDRLEQRGWLERGRGEVDRRVVTVRISESGLALLAALDAPVAAHLERVMTPLSEAEQRTLLELVERLRRLE
jgi:MarR family transcriptional regulator, organic hydroperoxide resistance regulator